MYNCTFVWPLVGDAAGFPPEIDNAKGTLLSTEKLPENKKERDSADSLSSDSLDSRSSISSLLLFCVHVSYVYLFDQIFIIEL